jgi:hypothetical protein
MKGLAESDPECEHEQDERDAEAPAGDLLTPLPATAGFSLGWREGHGS